MKLPNRLPPPLMGLLIVVCALVLGCFCGAPVWYVAGRWS